MNSRDFQVDDLDSTLKELQNERHFLANQLAERRKKREALEKILEAETGKHSQLTEVHRKLSQTLQVGHHKVAQTQSQAESLENQIQKKRDDIKAVTKKYDEQKSLQLNSVRHVEEELSEIAKKMQEAKLFYTEEKIKKEIESVETKKKEMEKEISVIEADVESIRNEHEILLENSKSNAADSAEAAEGFTVAFRDEVLKIFQEENDGLDKCYNQQKKELALLEREDDGSAS